MLDPLEQLDLSDLPDYDADQEYKALVRAVRRQEGFGILFVRCSPEQGQRLIEQVQQDVPRKRCGVLTLSEALPEGDFFGRDANFLAEKPVEVVFVQGIEHSLLDYEETKRQSGWSAAESQAYSWKDVPPVLRNLNQQRDKFRNQLPACFVFLIPLFVVRYLTRRAPDFFDWRSGVFEFRDPQESITQKIQECFLEDYETAQRMVPTERTWQAIKIRDLLEETSPTPDDRFRLLFDLGMIQLANGSYDDFLVSWDKALELAVTTAENWNRRGQLLGIKKHYEEAIASYDQALEIKPDDHKAWYNRGISLKNLGRYEEAIASYDQALEVKPDDHEAWYNRGISLKNLGRYEEAIASYDQALEVKPDKHEAWYNRGISLDDLGRYEEAIASYDQALEVKPDKHEAWNNRGISLGKLGRYKEAIASYDQALEVKPDKHEVWNNRGISLDDLGRYEEAIASYDQALEVKPDKHEAWNNRGISLGKLGRYEEAIASYDQALEVKPDDATALANRGDIFRRLGQPEQALLNLNRAIELSPDYVWAIATRGQACAQLQHYELALQDLDRAIDLDPDYTWAIGYRGELYLWLHHYAKALEVLNQTLEQTSNSDWDYYLRALAIARTVGDGNRLETAHHTALKAPATIATVSADLTQAIHLAQTQLENDPADWHAHFNLALYHTVVGHYQAAQTLYETGLNTAPAWAIQMAYRDLRDYLQLFPNDETAQAWCERLQANGPVN